MHVQIRSRTGTFWVKTLRLSTLPFASYVAGSITYESYGPVRGLTWGNGTATVGTAVLSPEWGTRSFPVGRVAGVHSRSEPTRH